MTKPEYNFEQIEAYLLGKLSLKELEAFQRELEQNEELSQEVEYYRFIVDQVKRLNEREYVRGLVSEVLEEEEEGKKVVPLRKDKGNWKIWGGIAVAASIVLIVAIYLIPSKRLEIHEPGYKLLTQEELSNWVTSGAAENVKEQTVQLYNDEKYKEAYQLVDSLSKVGSDSLDFEVRLIKGLLLAQQDKRSQALVEWNFVLEGEYGNDQKCRVARVLFWTQFQEGELEGLKTLHEKWDYIDDCPNIDPKEKETIKMVLSHPSQLLKKK